MESNSRRSFLQLAATLGALAPAAGKAAAQPAAPTLPTVKFGKFEITRLIVGANPLYGYSHFNHTMDQLMREWYTQDRKMEVLHACERQGINTWQLHYNDQPDRKSTRLNSSHLGISYAVFCLKKKNIRNK